MFYLRLFGFSLLITTGLLSTIFFIHRNRSPEAKLVPIASGVYLASQLQPETFPRISRRVRTIVDIRPDGEAKDQPSSETMAATAQRFGLSFHYIPVPHEEIPDRAVKELADVLATDRQPVVLYCRTGRRAVRTFALAQATRPQGPAADAICKMVADSGFTAEDLRGAIEERIAKRQIPVVP